MTYDSEKYGYDPYAGPTDPETGTTALLRPPRKLGCIIDYLHALGEGEGCTEEDNPELYAWAMSEVEAMISDPDNFFAALP